MQHIVRVCSRILLLFSVVSNSALAGESPEHVDGAITVNTQQAKRLHELGALFIDIRTRQEWNWGHVKSARPLGLKSTFSLLYQEGVADRKKPIVIYGSGTHRVRSAFASYLAVLWGYEKVFYFREGYFSWLAFDLPVVMLGDKSIK